MSKKKHKGDEKPYGGKSREDRIREEILAAHRTSGIQAPSLIPRGNRFRSETTSRPQGAVSLEAELATVTGAVNRDNLSSPGAAPTRALAQAILCQIGDDPDLLLTRLECDVKRIARTATPELLRTVGEQLNLVADLGLDDARVARMISVLDDIYYGRIDLKDVKGMPGGGIKRD